MSGRNRSVVSASRSKNASARTQARTHTLTHTQMDRQLKNIMSPAVHKIGCGSIRTVLLQGSHRLQTLPLDYIKRLRANGSLLQPQSTA